MPSERVSLHTHKLILNPPVSEGLFFYKDNCVSNNPHSQTIPGIRRRAGKLKQKETLGGKQSKP